MVYAICLDQLQAIHPRSSRFRVNMQTRENYAYMPLAQDQIRLLRISYRENTQIPIFNLEYYGPQFRTQIFRTVLCLGIIGFKSSDRA